jgi:hypothetical protein
MKKVILFLSLMLCFMVQNSYAQQPYYGNGDGSEMSDGCCPPEQKMNDCYCLYCRYKPKCYTVQRCEYCPKYGCKRCCRYVTQCYQKQCCRYVPQYYCKTCTKCVPQYYTVPTCCYVPKYHCEKHVKYIPEYYYKHTCAPACQPACQPECPPACNDAGNYGNWNNEGYSQNMNEGYNSMNQGYNPMNQGYNQNMNGDGR